MSKIRADIKKLNDKNFIIKRIYEMEKEEKFKINKKLLIGESATVSDEDDEESLASHRAPEMFEPRAMKQTRQTIQVLCQFYNTDVLPLQNIFKILFCINV